jgi:TRAP-type transport system periplasmic protein
MKIKKELVLTLISAVCIFSMLSGCKKKTEDDKTAGNNTVSETKVFRVGLQNPETHPLCQGIKKFGEILKTKSDGKLSLDIYYSGQLGDKSTQMQTLQTGVLDASMIMSGVLVDYGAKNLAVFTLPYLFNNVQHARATEKSPVGKKLLASIQSSGTKMIGLGYYQESARNYFFKKRRVTSVADMKGLKIRCQEGSIYIEEMKTFGVSPVSIAFSELYSALQTGVVDGAEQPISGFFTNQYQELCKYYLLDGHELSPNIILFSEIVWNQLTPDEQKLIQDSFDESVDYFNMVSDQNDASMLEKMKTAGVEILTPDNSREWHDAVAGLYTKYASEYADTISAIRQIQY